MQYSKMDDLEQQLRTIVRQSAWFIQALTTARDINLDSWCIGAGAVRSLVWDYLHHQDSNAEGCDVDLVYFDSNEKIDAEQQHQKQLQLKTPDISWDVTNQAFVHIWFEQYFGYRVSPLNSLYEAISTWPEYATCVGIYLTAENQLEIIAPYGLQDLFAMHIRHNPKRASVETYRHRITSKCYNQRWPKVVVFTESIDPA